MLSIFTGRITIPVRGACLIQKATALVKPFTWVPEVLLGFLQPKSCGM